LPKKNNQWQMLKDNRALETEGEGESVSNKTKIKKEYR
jgi:hypothetical protein